MNADCSNVRPIGNFSGNVNAPTWAREGRAIVFASTRDDPMWDLYMVDRDGSNLRRLTDNFKIDRYPAWHP